MKKVEAFIRPTVLEEVKETLGHFGIRLHVVAKVP